MSKAQSGGAETLQYINSDFTEQAYPQMTTGISNVNTVIYEEITTGARFISFKDTFMKFLPYIWLMWIVLKDLTPYEILKSVCYSGQEYFDAFYDHAIKMYESNDEEYMREFEPAAWILIEMDYIK